jgi:hypothetical protein
MVIVRSTLAFLLGLLFLFAFPASAQDAEPEAKTKKKELRLRGRGIFLYEIRHLEKHKDWSDEFQLARARFDARWQPTKGLRLSLELELTQGVEIKDVFVRYMLHRAVRLKLGYFKKPFSPLRMSSRWDLLIPRRGLVDWHAVGGSTFGGFGSRDCGVMFFGRFGKRKNVRVRYYLGMFDGWRLSDSFLRDPDNPDESNFAHRDYVARIQASLFDRVLVGVSYNHKQGRMALAPGVENTRTFNAISGDISVALAGLGLALEGIYASNPNATSGHNLMGGHGTISFRLKISDSLFLTPAFMAEYLDPDDQIDENHAVRLAGAINLDIGRYTRVILGAEGGWGEMEWETLEFEDWEKPYIPYNPPRKVDTRIYLQLNVRL